MPEHDETDAPEEETTSPTRLRKVERWGVQDKKVDEAETK